ncbi:hypothetical protein BDP27DRAFT_529173 [Rhodocollybia butyracea]|uniref:Uncharacterized protein n=1 Tax=Rhodocollybia butyracea TaxID=206335 RepID=A0A9P5TX25_9AGAR|nr:hypothetical protein BDP27DRAFT_529173 [Rhodocollybia butyracea]
MNPFSESYCYSEYVPGSTVQTFMISSPNLPLPRRLGLTKDLMCEAKNHAHVLPKQRARSSSHLIRWFYAIAHGQEPHPPSISTVHASHTSRAAKLIARKNICGRRFLGPCSSAIRILGCTDNCWSRTRAGRLVSRILRRTFIRTCRNMLDINRKRVLAR